MTDSTLLAPAPVAPKSKRRWPWIAAVPVTFVFAFAIGTSTGGAMDIESTPAAASDPVDTTPQSCLDALDYAETGFGYASDSMAAAGRGFVAASNLDAAGMTAAKADIEAATGQLDSLAPSWNEAKAACRAAAE
jgi:hypothetical protein